MEQKSKTVIQLHDVESNVFEHKTCFDNSYEKKCTKHVTMQVNKILQGLEIKKNHYR